MGSPPPIGSKNEVLMLRSVRSIVIAPANTGRDRTSKMAVINTDHTNKGTFSHVMLGACILMTVDIKLIAPRMDEIPARCREKMAKSTDLPE